MKGSPWTPLVVLSLLQGGELHGYGIARRAREESENLITMNEGLLYPLLHDLEKQGLIASRWDRPEAGRDRKYYRLTELGRGRLAEGRQEWRHQVRVLSTLLGVSQ